MPTDRRLVPKHPFTGRGSLTARSHGTSIRRVAHFLSLPLSAPESLGIVTHAPRYDFFSLKGLRNFPFFPYIRPSRVCPRSTTPYSSSPLVALSFRIIMHLPSFLIILGMSMPSVFAQEPGSIVVAGDTLVSAMMVCH